VPFAFLEVAIEHGNYPSGYERWAWTTAAVFAVGASMFLFARGRLLPLVFDAVIVSAYVCIYRSSRAHLCASSSSCLWSRQLFSWALAAACCGPL
jgi:hypothetical protein